MDTVTKKNAELVQEKQKQGLDQCLQRIEQWEKIKEDYQILKSRLETLADKLSYEVMVPFGSQAFMPGRIVNTNEILVLLGDNWFVERSTKQAAEIAERRISCCNKMLEGLHAEKYQFENWMKFTSEVTGDGETVEIVEEYDPEKEKEWRAKHRQNVQAYRKKEAMKREMETQKCNSIDKPMDDKALWERLEELEMKEKESNELESVEEEATSASNEPDQEASSSNNNNNNNAIENKKNVRWKDQQVIITFKHSSPSASPIKNNASSEGMPLLNSPADIYDMFKKDDIKSILKVKASPDSDDMDVNTVWSKFVGATGSESVNPLPQSYLPDDDRGIYEDDFQEEEEFVTVPAFSGEVMERPVKPVDEIPSSSSSSRPVSQFKKQRSLRK